MIILNIRYDHKKADETIETKNPGQLLRGSGFYS